MWVLAADRKIVARQMTYVPALFHIFDEILVNAADNKHRNTGAPLQFGFVSS